MTRRTPCPVRGALGLAAIVFAAAGDPQTLGRRIAAAPDGGVRFSYAARPGVIGNGGGVVSWNCEGGSCRSRGSRAFPERGRVTCDTGPVRVELTKQGVAITALRVTVGDAWRTSGGADLGTVRAAEAAKYLLSLARSPVGEEAVFAATLADSATVWPELLRLARDETSSRQVRRTAIFWLGQAAEEQATDGLDRLVQADTGDRDLREAAVFALSQRPHDQGVPALIRIARAHADPEIRRKSLFWLGQSGDPRAVALFEELLLRQ